tara:strand:+ start:309 stop:1673 length:1365 start_codon:yes stop_codon:yes gene_type:complete
MQNYIQFINHASVAISNGNKTILTDPWYSGGAFDDGWSLIYNNDENKIKQILSNVDFIWISHEHPDHFSIKFFNEYYDLIKEKKIKFIFQKTKDQRVSKFLKFKDFQVFELEDNQSFMIDTNFEIKIHKSDFYDSALIINLNGKKIFNLNDCPMNSSADLEKFKKIYGSCDFLLTQFSYAAWKGGKKNIKWRQIAANEKLETLIKQSNILETKYLIPFASYIYFSDHYNFYLNDSVNTPDRVLKIKNNINSKILFFRPYEKISLNGNEIKTEGYKFWQEKFNEINEKKLNNNENYKIYDFDILKKKFEVYRKDLFLKNSLSICRILSKVKFLKIFLPIIVKLKDIDKVVKIDVLQGEIELSQLNPDIEMNTKSLYLIFDQGYGFDALTVNGCFEELNQDGFIKMTQSLALGNLNNIGVYLNYSVIFNFKIIFLFLKKIFSLKKKINYNYIQTLE